jgi:hypothetical protein
MQPTASRASLFFECQWWARPDVHVADTSAGNKAAVEGKRVHKVVELFLARRCTPEAAVQAFGERRDMRLLYWLDSKYKSRWVAPEMKLAYNPTTGVARLLASTKDRDYSEATSAEFCGTADMVMLEDSVLGQVVHVSDLKTGNPYWLEPTVSSGQLATLGLMIAALTGRDRMLVSYLLTKGGIRRPDPVLLDANALTVTRSKLRAAMEAKTNALPVLNDQCWKCPAKKHCPAYKDATYD